MPKKIKILRTVAVVLADLHLSHTPPPTYTVTQDEWYSHMKRVLKYINEVSKEHDAPIIVAGDLLDKWDVPPELINFCLRHLPEMYTIPGQHEIPYHNIKLLKKSGYWTLCRAGKFINLPAGVPTVINDKVTAVGFPWECKIKSFPETFNTNTVKLAVAHSYVWQSSANSFVGAPKQKRLGEIAPILKTYDAAVFGDNHIPFDAKIGNCKVFNCGPIFQRSIKEMLNYPRIGLLKNDGSIETVELKEVCLPLITTNGNKEEPNEHNSSVQLMMLELAKLGATAYEFKQIIFQQLDKHPEYSDSKHPVRQIILDALVRSGRE